MKTEEDYKIGQVLLIDKPLNWTSFQVVNKLRWAILKAFIIKKIKVGHAGTLDPLATGLLVICTGKMTQQINTFQGQEKEYTGTFVLGSTTPSFDLETKIDKTFSTDHITPDLIHKTTKQFVGKIKQFPPVFSALKKDGKRLYEYARAGENIEIKSREVEISEFKIIEINLLPTSQLKKQEINTSDLELKFKVTCSKGTYIRSLAHDFGKALNSGAYLSELRRIRIGGFKIEDALSIEAFIETLALPISNVKDLLNPL